jgi:hypothetical protein
MATTNPSLFGMLGDEAAMQRQLDEQKAMQFANMTQGQRLASMGYRAGAGLGRGVASLFGEDIVDPAVRQASQIRQLASQFDTTTPEGMMQFARAVKDINPNMASQAAQQAQAMMKTSSEISKNLRERAAADPFQKLTESGKYTPASLAKYRESGNVADLELAKDQLKTSITTVDGNKVLVNDMTGDVIKVLGKAGKTIEESLGEGLGMLGKALGPALKKEGEETGQFAAKDFNALGSAVASGTASKRNIQIMDTALKNAFTGKFSDTKESVVTAIQGLGLPVGEDLKQAASNTQLINAMGTRYVFPLVKNFPGSLAAKELDRLEKTAPGSLQQPETIRTLMNLLKVDLAENEFVYGKAKEYKNANKGSTINFNQADARIEFQNKLNDLRSRVAAARQKGSMTAAEKSQIDALKKDIGVE